MTNLADLVEQQLNRARSQGNQQPRWIERREKWRLELDSLYSRLRQWLHDANLPEECIEQSQQLIREENLGEYFAAALVFTLGNEQIHLQPVGTLLVGALGRVDMSARRPASPLFHIIADFSAEPDSNLIEFSHQSALEQDWQWFIAPSSAKYRSQPLSSESFAAALQELVADVH